MSYSSAISRVNPAAILFLLDQSASMQDSALPASDPANDDRSKAEVLAGSANDLIRNLILRCAKEDGVRDYFYCGAISYGASVTNEFEDLGVSKNTPGLVPISVLADQPKAIRTRMRRLVSPSGSSSIQSVYDPIWFEPRAQNGTPMCFALQLASQVIEAWVANYPKSFPPIVINITDGEATDGDPLPFAREIMSYETDDGETLLFNVHLSSTSSTPIELPDSVELLTDGFSRQLFRMSSELPASMRMSANAEGFSTTLDTRGFVFNANPSALARFLEIGTRPANLY